MKLGYKFAKTEELENLKKELSNLRRINERATSFIKDIEAGNLESNLILAEEDKDSIIAALMSMRDRMKTIAEEERRRNWVTQGLATFIDILRSNESDIGELSNYILSHLVKYLNANQAAIFVINEELEPVALEMTGCYAYGRKKFIGSKVLPGEGLVGQCYLERETIYLTEVPESYVRITSGVGGANPRSILIVPLKVNEQIYGILEIASFHPLEKFEIEFVEKLCESIAGTLSTVKINQKTKKLLDESLDQTSQLKQQEEEMRQNLEELAATQEEMKRKENRMQQLLEETKEKESALQVLAEKHRDEVENLTAELERLKLNLKRKEKRIQELEHPDIT